MSQFRWSLIPYGTPLKVDGHGEVYYLMGGAWRSVHLDTGITRREIEYRYVLAYGGCGVPPMWVFDDVVDSTSVHAPADKAVIDGEDEEQQRPLIRSPLNRTSVKKANRSLWRKCPELKRRRLTMGAEDLRYRRIWAMYYRRYARPAASTSSSASSSSAQQAATQAPSTHAAETTGTVAEQQTCFLSALSLTCSHGRASSPDGLLEVVPAETGDSISVSATVNSACGKTPRSRSRV